MLRSWCLLCLAALLIIVIIESGMERMKNKIVGRGQITPGLDGHSKEAGFRVSTATLVRAEEGGIIAFGEIQKHVRATLNRRRN